MAMGGFEVMVADCGSTITPNLHSIMDTVDAHVVGETDDVTIHKL
jgi:hypothetical protein